MTKQLIIKELSERHKAMVDYVLSLTPKEFMFSFQNKWTAGQQMDHIIRATTLLPLAFNLPLFITRLIFGTLNRAPLEYDELVRKYLSKLEKGAKATTIFIPQQIPYTSRIKQAEKLLRKISKINSAVDLIPETALDHYLLPHPILGKITYREMLYFTMYHVNHHFALAKRYLAEK